MGKLTSFPQSVKLKSDETVVFSWLVFKSHRLGKSKALSNRKLMPL